MRTTRHFILKKKQLSQTKLLEFLQNYSKKKVSEPQILFFNNVIGSVEISGRDKRRRERSNI